MKLEKLPDYGDHMTIEEFEAACQNGGFIDYDGTGNYATDREMSDIEVSPSDITAKNYKRKPLFSHVVWFNK
jgi:hypothetical protein